jgi:hypothetical protein
VRGSSGFVGLCVLRIETAQDSGTGDLLRWPLWIVCGMGVDGSGIEAVRELDGGGCVCEKG